MAHLAVALMASHLQWQVNHPPSRTWSYMTPMMMVFPQQQVFEGVPKHTSCCGPQADRISSHQLEKVHLNLRGVVGKKYQ